jgi:hypothetical protein
VAEGRDFIPHLNPGAARRLPADPRLAALLDDLDVAGVPPLIPRNPSWPRAPGHARGLSHRPNQLLVGDVAHKLLAAVVVRLVLPSVVLQRLITRVVLEVEIAAGEAGEAGEGG